MERTTQTDLWTSPDASTLGTDVARRVGLTGFSVEATDGGIGKIDETTYHTSQSYIVVDTGPWIFGKKVLLPAGVIDRIDMEDETIFVRRTKDQIKDAPEMIGVGRSRRGLPLGSGELLRAGRSRVQRINTPAPGFVEGTGRVT